MSIKRHLGQIVNGKYVKSGIIDTNIKKGQEHAGHRDHVRMTMARDYARDLIQRGDPDFAEAFPNPIRSNDE